MEHQIDKKDPEHMDLADIILEYEDIVSRIHELEERREQLREHILNICEDKDIDVLRIGDVEVTRHRAEWKIWNIDELKPYLEQKGLWGMVETVDRKGMSELIEDGILREEELEGMYDVDVRYSLYVKREE